MCGRGYLTCDKLTVVMFLEECWPKFITNIEYLQLAIAPFHVLQIQVKAERSTSISKFFSRKGAESEGTKREQKIVPSHESVKTEQPKEAKTEEGDNDLKSSGFSNSQDATKVPIKRDYEAFSADSKPALAKNDLVSSHPVKKREKAKTADDKQPNLFSYFAKR